MSAILVGIDEHFGLRWFRKVGKGLRGCFLAPVFIYFFYLFLLQRLDDLLNAHLQVFDIIFFSLQ